MFRVLKFYFSNFIDKKDEVFRSPFLNFEDNFLWVKSKNSKEKSVVGFLEIDGFDISIYDDNEIQRCIDIFQDIFKFSRKRITIIKTQDFISIEQNINYYEKNKSRMQSQEKLNLLENYYNDLNRIEKNSKINKYYVALYESSPEKLETLLNEVSIYLRSCRLDSRVLQKLKTLNLVNKLNLLDSFEWTSLRNLDEDEFIFRQYRHKKIIQKPSYFIHDNDFYSVQVVEKLHFILNPSWAKTIFNSESSVIWHIDDQDFEATKKLLNTSIINLKITEDIEKNSVNRKKAQFEREALEELSASIAAGKNRIKKNSIFLFTKAKNKEEINKIRIKNKRNISEINCKLNDLNFQQLSAFKELWFNNENKLFFSQEIPADTLAESWPFFTNSLNDKNLLLLGKTRDNNFLIWDQFLRDQNRKNFNMFILGTSGSGKSSLTKKILLNHLTFNQKVIIIDPEREYFSLVKAFKGSWIELGKGRNTSINPLQIRIRLENQTALTYTQIISAHIRWVELWFRSLYDSFNETSIKLLTFFVTKLYKEWKFFSEKKDISSLLNTDFPIISDLIKLIELEVKKKKNNDLELLLLILKTDFENQGRYYNIYNNYTNISFENKLLVFDVHNLYEVETSATIKTAFLTILSLIQDQIVSNYNAKDKVKIVICIDEAHLLIDEENPQILNYLIRTIKRIRKYRGGVILTTQNPGDFVGSPRIQNKTQAIVNNMQYSAFLNMRSKDVEAVDKMFNNVGGLTEYEKKFLVTAQVGQCIFSLDVVKRFMISVNYNYLEKKLIFKN